MILAAAIAASACGSGGKKGMPAQRQTEQTAQGARSRTLRRPTVPIEESITVEKRRAWLAGHFWDDYPFEADTDPTLYDTLDMCRALAEYVSECVTPENADSLLGGLMRRAHCSRPMLDYFAMLADEVLHDPNSPLRNDEYYIPVLRVLVASPYYDEYDRIAPQYALDMALRNRPGEAANDFAYTLADGRSRRMYDIDTDYLPLQQPRLPGVPTDNRRRNGIAAAQRVGRARCVQGAGHISRHRSRRMARLSPADARGVDQRLRRHTGVDPRAAVRLARHTVDISARQRKACSGQGRHQRRTDRICSNGTPSKRTIG